MERDKVREAIAAAHRGGSEFVSLHSVQEALRGQVNPNTVAGQIHQLRASGELETAPVKLPLGNGQRPVTAYRLGTIDLSPRQRAVTGVEVHLAGGGWRRFDQANAYEISDGTLRLMEVGEPPENTVLRLVAVFPPGGWQGLAVGDARELAPAQS